MNRRIFLQSIIGLGATALFHPNAFAEKNLQQEVKAEVEDLLLLENTKKYEKSFFQVGEKEMETFIKFFEISDKKETLANDFVKKVKQLQKEAKFGEKLQDGVLQPSILKEIYVKYYSVASEKIDSETKKRWEIYNEMQGYSKKSGALYSKLNVFHINDYYGAGVGINKTGTFINDGLIGRIPEIIDDNETKIIVEKLDDKKILRFYVDGKLFLATYVSPGTLGHKTPKLKTKGKNKPDKYHTSSEYPEAEKKKNGIKGGAVMPYAVHIDGAIWIHGSDGKINGFLQSHGCIRTPLFYVKEIYDKVKEFGIDKVTIDTTGIY